MNPDLPGPSGSRVPPPQVDPVDLNGIRYEQARSGIPLDATDPSGWLRATKTDSGEELWLRQIYTSPQSGADPDLPGGGRTIVYMKRLSVSGDAILVEDIKGRSFLVDAITGDVTPQQ